MVLKNAPTAFFWIVLAVIGWVIGQPNRDAIMPYEIERCWGILENHGNGTLLDSIDPVPAISGDLLSAVISTRYILVFRKDNPNVFNSLIQNWPRFQRHKIHMLLILLALCLRKPNGISHLLSMAYAIAGNG